ncbi:MAG: biopolymer transporter ExbD [Bradymonadaceae bacterium]|nr:biopolymer transporter ExbD [Lujinxingiaceae bacterium]
MFNKRRRKTSEVYDLNVVPVMNLFMVLIPFLLLGAAFYQIGVIPTATATHDPNASDVPATPTTVSANLVIKPDAIALSFASTSLGEEALSALSIELPKKDDQYDIEGLRTRLTRVKQLYPESTTMTILPHNELPYQVLVEVVDGVRERPLGFDDKGDAKFEELFPVTVFSKFIPPGPDSPVLDDDDYDDEEE